ADVRMVGISVGPHSHTSPDQPQRFGNVRPTRFVQAVRRLAQARDGKYRGASHSKEPAKGSACAPVLIACLEPGSGVLWLRPFCNSSESPLTRLVTHRIVVERIEAKSESPMNQLARIKVKLYEHSQLETYVHFPPRGLN